MSTVPVSEPLGHSGKYWGATGSPHVVLAGQGLVAQGQESKIQSMGEKMQKLSKTNTVLYTKNLQTR